MKTKNYERRTALMQEASRYRERSMSGANEAVFLRWACDRGHTWNDALSQAQNVRCMNCASQRREIETKRLNDIAEIRGGEVISPGGVDPVTPPTWRCAYGHEWDAQPEAAERSWCAECACKVFANYR